MEAVAGTMMAGPSELTGVVTVLHDQTEAIERERLYAELQRAVGATRGQGPRSDRGARASERAAAAAGAGARAGVGGQVAVSRQRLARVPHAAQRHPRLLADADGRLLRAADARSSRAPCSASTPTASTSRRSSTTCSTSSASRPAACRCRFRSSRSRTSCGEVLEELQGVIAQSTVAVQRRRAADDVPRFKSDRQKVKQILVNLLSNALEVHQGRHDRDPRAARPPPRAAST